MIFMLLTNKDNFRNSDKRTAGLAPGDMKGLAGKDGKIKGRSADGKPMQAKIGGKSKVQMIRERKAAEAKAAGKTPPEPPKRRRRGRK